MPKLLVIDDSATAVRFVESAFAREGYVVEALTSFVHAAAAVRDCPPDLILLDLTMPALSGLSMGQIIRKYQSREIPIVVYSSRPTPELKEAARALSAVAYVQKSESAEALVATVRAVLGGRRAGAG